MGRALIGCCHWTTANQSSPHRGPSIFVGDLDFLNTHHELLLFVYFSCQKQFKRFKCQVGNCTHSIMSSLFDSWQGVYAVSASNTLGPVAQWLKC